MFRYFLLPHFPFLLVFSQLPCLPLLLCQLAFFLLPLLFLALFSVNLLTYSHSPFAFFTRSLSQPVGPIRCDVTLTLTLTPTVLNPNDPGDAVLNSMIQKLGSKHNDSRNAFLKSNEPRSHGRDSETLSLGTRNCNR
jgi:hypothetical protein